MILRLIKPRPSLMSRRERSKALAREIIALYDYSISLNMINNTAYHDRALEKAYLGDYQGAIEDYDICIKQDIISWSAHMQRGRCCAKLGNYKEAIHDFNMVVYHGKPFPEVLEERAKAKFKIKDYPGAIKDCDKVLMENPQNYTTLHLKGDAQLELGNKKDALDSYKEIIKYGEHYFDLVAVKTKVTEMQSRANEK